MKGRTPKIKIYEKKTGKLVAEVNYSIDAREWCKDGKYTTDQPKQSTEK